MHRGRAHWKRKFTEIKKGPIHLGWKKTLGDCNSFYVVLEIFCPNCLQLGQRKGREVQGLGASGSLGCGDYCWGDKRLGSGLI
jgi:hypothetical protein